MNALPNSLDAERSVCGAALLSRIALAEAAGLVEPADFYHPAHEAIFRAACELDATGQPADAVTVAAHMTATGAIGKLRALGGDGYFADLMVGVVTPENVAFHARIVAEKAAARRLMLAGQEIAAKGFGDYGAFDDYAGAAERLVFDAVQRRRAEQYHGAGEILRTVIDTIGKRHERKQAITGVASGYPKLDAMTAGFQPAELSIVAARPSMGKTALAVGIMAGAAIERRQPVLFFSLEMSKESLIERMIASEGRIDTMRLRTGMLETRDWIAAQRAAARINTAPIWIYDQPASMSEIRSRARRWRMNERQGGQHEAALVIVDYLQIIQPAPGKRREQNREREVAEISKALKELAKELRAPVLALAQLSRECERRADKRPTLADLRESGQVEQDADLIAFLYRDEVYNAESQDRGTAEVILGKQRNGAIGTVRLAYVGQYTRFENLSERAA